MIKKILTYIFFWKGIIYVAAAIAIPLLPIGDAFYFVQKSVRGGLPYLGWIFGNFDGVHYLEIARRGYQAHEFGFFPLYPWLISIISGIFYIPALLSSQIISTLCLILALIVIHRLLTIDKKTSLINLMLIIILTFPTSFFYQAVYNDSLFFLLANLCLYFGRGRKWFRAGVFGGLATLTRLNGLALVFFVLVEYFGDEAKSWSKKIRPLQIVKNGIYWVSLIPAGFLGYLLYINTLVGSWTALFSSMKVWNQDKVTFPLQVFWRYLKIFFSVSPGQFVYWVAVFETLFVLFYIFLLVYSFKKIRPSYWIFSAVSILIPMLTGTFAGMPRYGLHLYPLFLSLLLLFRDKSVKIKILYFLISMVLGLFYLAFFTRGYFVT